MNMDRRLFIFSVVLAVSITLKPIPIALQGGGQSSDSKSDKKDKGKTNPRKKDKANPQIPIQITVTAPEISPDDKARSDAQREREVLAQEAIVSLTSALKTIAIVQAVITAVALLASIRAANAAKKSADIAANALHLTQGADIHLHELFYGSTTS
jgi:hypothetical protein